MTTETDLRAALRARADDAPAVDVDRLVAAAAGDRPPVRVVRVDRAGRVPAGGRGTAGRRRWAVVAVAAGVVALAAVPTAVVLGARGHGGSGGSGGSAAGASGARPPAPSAVTFSAISPSTSPTTPGSRSSVRPSSWPAVNPYAPGTPFPVDTTWVWADGGSTPVDDAAIAFSDDPITGFYQRAGQQLSILPAAAGAKDSSDAAWYSAVQVLLPESGFDPDTMTDATPVQVGGISRRFGELPRLLDTGGTALAPSLLWPVGQAWVVLQVDAPDQADLAALTAAAARLDVHHG